MKNRIPSLFVRIGAVLLLAVLLLIPAFAAGDTVYSVPWAGIEVSLPSDYIVVTCGDTTGGDSNDGVDTQDLYLYADWTDELGQLDFSVMVYDFGDSNLEYATCSEAQLQSELNSMEAYFRENFQVQSIGTSSNPNTNFIWVSYIDGSGNYWESYVTGHYQEYTMFEVGSYGKPLSDLADTILYDMIATVAPVTGGSSGASGTVDASSGLAVQSGSDTIQPLDPPERVVIPGLENAQTVSSVDTSSSGGSGSYETGSDDRTSDSDSGATMVVFACLGVVIVLILVGISSVKKSRKKNVKKAPVKAAVHTPTPAAAPVRTPAATPSTPVRTPTAPAAAPKAPAAPKPDFWATPAAPGGAAKAPETKTLKFCPGCGGELKPGAAFCGRCGRKLS